MTRSHQLIHTIVESVEDDNNTTQISLVQSRAFNRVEHQYVAAVLQAAGLQSDFCCIAPRARSYR